MVIVRDAGPGDVAAVAGLEQRNLGIDAWSEGLVREAVEGRLPTLRVLVAEVGGDVVGFAVASLVAEVAELQRIAVDRAHRRGGVASRLLDRVRELAADEDADQLLLEVREDNAAALAFYENELFAEVGRRPRYYKDGATAVVLSLGLGRRGGAVGA